MNFRNVISGLAILPCILIGAFTAVPTYAATTQADEPQHQPFRIAGNLYYVGSTGHGAYLLTTPQGSILINSNYPDSPPLIRQSVEKLGFKWADIKILLISHAHIDHDGGSAQIVKETGAKYAVMQADVDVVETGGKTDYHYGDDTNQYYPPAKVDRVLHDGDTVQLGGTTLTAHLTAGHTKGTTTWTFDETEGGRLLHVVIMGGPTLNRGMKMLDNPKYPDLVADYKNGFAVLQALPCDIPLGPHDWYFGLGEKYKRFMAGDKNAFIDPDGYKAFVEKSQQGFEAQLQKQKAAAQNSAKPSGN